MTLKRILVTLKSMISDKLALTGALIMNVAPCTVKKGSIRQQMNLIKNTFLNFELLSNMYYSKFPVFIILKMRIDTS